MTRSAFFGCSAKTAGASLQVGPSQATDMLRVSSAPGQWPTSTPVVGATTKYRFPSTRRYLWDRTPSAAAEIIQPQVFLPNVEVNPGILQSAQASLQHTAAFSTPKQAQIMLMAKLGTAIPSMQRCTLSLQPRSPGQAAVQDGFNVRAVPCSIHSPATSDGSPASLAPAGQEALPPLSPEAVQCMDAAIASGLDGSGPSHLGQLLSACCQLLMRSDGTALLKVYMLLPAAPLSLSPLLSKRLCETAPLSGPLTRPLAPGHAPSSGFLTLDQARSLVPLGVDDSGVFSAPLVGIWVAGVTSPSHPLVFAACLRFVFGSSVLDRAAQPDGSFLVLVFPPEGCSLPRCYEGRFMTPAGGGPGSDGSTTPLELATYTCQGELLPRHGGGSAAGAQALAPVMMPPPVPLAHAAPLVIGPRRPAVMSLFFSQHITAGHQVAGGLRHQGGGHVAEERQSSPSAGGAAHTPASHPSAAHFTSSPLAQRVLSRAIKLVDAQEGSVAAGWHAGRGATTTALAPAGAGSQPDSWAMRDTGPGAAQQGADGAGVQPGEEAGGHGERSGTTACSPPPAPRPPPSIQPTPFQHSSAKPGARLELGAGNKATTEQHQHQQEAGGLVPVDPAPPSTLAHSLSAPLQPRALLPDTTTALYGRGLVRPLYNPLLRSSGSQLLPPAPPSAQQAPLPQVGGPAAVAAGELLAPPPSAAVSTTTAGLVASQGYAHTGGVSSYAGAAGVIGAGFPAQHSSSQPQPTSHGPHLATSLASYQPGSHSRSAGDQHQHHHHQHMHSVGSDSPRLEQEVLELRRRVKQLEEQLRDALAQLAVHQVPPHRPRSPTGGHHHQRQQPESEHVQPWEWWQQQVHHDHHQQQQQQHHHHAQRQQQSPHAAERHQMGPGLSSDLRCNSPPGANLQEVATQQAAAATVPLSKFVIQRSTVHAHAAGSSTSQADEGSSSSRDQGGAQGLRTPRTPHAPHRPEACTGPGGEEPAAPDVAPPSANSSDRGPDTGHTVHGMPGEEPTHAEAAAPQMQHHRHRYSASSEVRALFGDGESSDEPESPAAHATGQVPEHPQHSAYGPAGAAEAGQVGHAPGTREASQGLTRSGRATSSLASGLSLLSGLSSAALSNAMSTSSRSSSESGRAASSHAGDHHLPPAPKSAHADGQWGGSSGGEDQWGGKPASKQQQGVPPGAGVTASQSSSQQTPLLLVSQGEPRDMRRLRSARLSPAHVALRAALVPGEQQAAAALRATPGVAARMATPSAQSAPTQRRAARYLDSGTDDDEEEEEEKGDAGSAHDADGGGDDSDREMDEALMRKYGIRL